MQPITLETLQVFPLPKSIESLPEASKSEFVNSTRLLNGHLQSLSTYTTFNKQVLSKVQEVIGVYEHVIELIGEYDTMRSQIKQQLDEITTLYNRFADLQLEEYKLLANNYNVDLLIRVKFRKVVELNDSESRELAKGFRPTNFDEEFGPFIDNFVKSRKQYHLRKEVMNRWEEERVSGAI